MQNGVPDLKHRREVLGRGNKLRDLVRQALRTIAEHPVGVAEGGVLALQHSRGQHRGSGTSSKTVGQLWNDHFVFNDEKTRDLAKGARRALMANNIALPSLRHYTRIHSTVWQGKSAEGVLELEDRCRYSVSATQAIPVSYTHLTLPTTPYV